MPSITGIALQTSAVRTVVDATAETCAYGDIPYSDRWRQGLISGMARRVQDDPSYQPQDNGVDVRSRVTLQATAPRPRFEVTMRGESGQGSAGLRALLTPRSAGDDEQDGAALANGGLFRPSRFRTVSTRRGLRFR